jgi:GR25 family glycosyltransferase involved in LPS biosynthesis
MPHNSPLLAGFERVYIINLPERTDRYAQIKEELASIGIGIDDAKVRIMKGQWSDSANGFTSLGAYGNFMSHLRILREAAADRLSSVWILEDDATFRHVLRSSEFQSLVSGRLAKKDWDIAYLGHAIDPAVLKAHKQELFVPLASDLEFLWAHCYAVSARGIPSLLAYLEETLINPPGHPRGGRMFIDGALNMYRRQHPEVCALASPINLSSQRGSTSSLAGGKFYDKLPATKALVQVLRGLRDEAWRKGLIK